MIAVWKAVWPAFKAILDAPLWHGGIFLVALFVLLLILSYLETRPRRRGRDEPLSPDDLLKIRELQSCYSRFGEPASQQLVTLLRGTQNDLIATNALAGLLAWPRNRLDETSQSFAHALDDPSGSTHVLASFTAFWEAYRDALTWTHCTEAEGVNLIEDFWEDYSGWEKDNEQFLDRITDLATGIYPEVGGVTKADIRKLRAESQQYSGWFLLAKARLQKLTDAEDSFLRLFSLGEDHFPSSDRLMPRDLYQAALDLDRDRIVQVNEEHGQFRVLLPRPVLSAWELGDARSAPIVRRKFEIPLEAIQGTGSSGGGASRSTAVRLSDSDTSELPRPAPEVGDPET